MDFLGPKVLVSQNWGSAEISAAMGVFLKICSCGSKSFKNVSNFKMVKNHHFSTFDDFFFLFGQTSPILPPRNFYMLWRYPSKIEKKAKNENYLSDLSDRNFCHLAEISAKIETLKSALKHISVP